MKLVRYGNPGKEKPGLIDAEGKLRDLSAVVKDFSGDQLGDATLAKLRKIKTDKLPYLLTTLVSAVLKPSTCMPPSMVEMPLAYP